MFETKESKQAKQAAQLKSLQSEQIAVANGERDGEYVEGNRRTGSKIRKHEADAYVHVEVINKNLQPDQKSFKEDKNVVKIHAREFDRRVEEGAFSTYDQAEVIHDPRANAPSSYKLKPETLSIDAGGPKADKNIALREQTLKKKEAAIADKFEELGDKEKEIAEKNAQLDQAIEEAKAKSAQLDALIEEAKKKAGSIAPAGGTASIDVTIGGSVDGAASTPGAENNASATAQKAAPKAGK
jgi:hypothetical protein